MNVEVYGRFAFGVQVWGLGFRIEGLLGGTGGLVFGGFPDFCRKGYRCQLIMLLTPPHIHLYLSSILASRLFVLLVQHPFERIGIVYIYKDSRTETETHISV